MANELQKQSDEVRNIGREAETDTGFQQMIKFKKGEYWSNEEEIALGTRFIAHCLNWTKSWVHFENRTVVERRNFIVAKGQKAPERDEIPDNDPTHWPIGINGKDKADPWVLQYLLPLEDPDTNEVMIFVGSSFGGRRAVGEVCSAYARRAAKQQTGQPIIELQASTFPTRNYGDVDRPLFNIVGWDDGEAQQTELNLDDTDGSSDAMKAAMDDEIPF
jgi:hypothetical protein